MNCCPICEEELVSRRKYRSCNFGSFVVAIPFAGNVLNCCPICEEEYQEEIIAPVILVCCGHTIGRKCA